MKRILLVKTSSLGDVVHNLPAASDINRLLQEIAYVERQLRVLAKTVDDAGRPAPQAGAQTPASSPRPRAARASRPAASSNEKD